jgi:hypothetical protein
MPVTEKQPRRAASWRGEPSGSSAAREFGRDKPHAWPGDRFADRLCVRSIVFLPLDVGLHVGRRHQPHGMADCLELARPMMRRCAGFNANDARWQLLKKRQYIPALDLAANKHVPRRVDAVDLKYRLCCVETDRPDHVHGADWPLAHRPMD